MVVEAFQCFKTLRALRRAARRSRLPSVFTSNVLCRQTTIIYQSHHHCRRAWPHQHLPSPVATTPSTPHARPADTSSSQQHSSPLRRPSPLAAHPHDGCSLLAASWCTSWCISWCRLLPIVHKTSLAGSGQDLGKIRQIAARSAACWWRRVEAGGGRFVHPRTADGRMRSFPRIASCLHAPQLHQQEKPCRRSLERLTGSCAAQSIVSCNPPARSPDRFLKQHCCGGVQRQQTSRL